MHSLARVRRRTYEVLEVAGPGDGLSRFFDLVIMGLVACNVAAVVLASVVSIEAAYHDLFIAFEQISIAFFSAEFLLRFWASAEGASQHGSTIRSRMRYLFSPLAMVDLLAIAPFYLSTFFAMDLRYLRILRLLRVVN